MTTRQILERNKRIFTELFIKEDLDTFVERHLGIDYKLALQGTLTPYIQYLISQSFYFEGQKSGRTDLELVKELIYSRCVELRLLEKWGRGIVFNGSDKDNLITKFASNRADLWEIGTNNYYEVMSTYVGMFHNKESVFITKGKMENLCHYAATTNQYLIAVDVMFQRYCFVKIDEDVHKMKGVEEMLLGKGYILSLKNATWYTMDEDDCSFWRAS